jgi:hypothetical protein
VLYSHDVQEALKLRLFARAPDDHVAWMYEKSGIFTVRSAYHLAVSIDRERENQESCSARADGSRPRFNCIWATKVLPKVKVFEWRLSQDGLATQSNRRVKGLENVATC